MKLYFWYQASHEHIHFSEKKPVIRDGELAFQPSCKITLDLWEGGEDMIGIDAEAMKNDPYSYIELEVAATSARKTRFIMPPPPPEQVEPLDAGDFFKGETPEESKEEEAVEKEDKPEAAQ